MNSPPPSTTDVIKRSIENAIELFDELFFNICPINFYNEAEKGRGVKLAVNSLTDRQCLIAKELSGHLSSARRNLRLCEDGDALSPAASRPGMAFLAAAVPVPRLTSLDPQIVAMEKKMSMLRDYLVNELVRSEGAEQALKIKEDELVEITAQCEKLKKKVAAMTASAANSASSAAASSSNTFFTIATTSSGTTKAATSVKSTASAVSHSNYAHSRAAASDRIDSQPASYVHTYVRKQFGNSYFFGIVASYDTVDQYFQVFFLLISHSSICEDLVFFFFFVQDSV